MESDAVEEEPCSLASTVAVIGDRWSPLILRECFLRVRRFDEFLASLGITRHLLADRLKKLVRLGVCGASGILAFSRRVPSMRSRPRESPCSLSSARFSGFQS